MIIGQLKMESIVQLIPEQFSVCKIGYYILGKCDKNFRPEGANREVLSLTDCQNPITIYLNNHLQEKTLSWIYYLCTFFVVEG